MSDFVPAAIDVAAVAARVADAARYSLVMEQLQQAQDALTRLSDIVSGLGESVEEVAGEVQLLVGIAASLRVDADTLGEHRDAAALMQVSQAHAGTLAASCADLGVLFASAADAHQGDYGAVVESVQAMPVPMADRTFYANR